MGELRFCYRCMEKFDSDQHICPHCGFDDSAPHNPLYIIPGTVLHDRYLVGLLLSYNGEGATYIGYDISTGCKVLMREYMPVNFCTRVKNKATISVNYNNLAKYKAFMAEYTELNKSLARLRNNPNINPVLDMFAENNTTYTIFEYIEGEKMMDFLKDNAGELSWEQVSKLFPPLFTTIGILHNAGIIHRAISPDTIYITDKGELKLSGFCVSAVRTADAGLEFELFKGYAAPEQYSASSSSRQGSWTDVYGVCALMYRALTGCMPVDSLSRLTHDDLCEPAMLNNSIPPHVSRVIMDGMNLSGRDRIQTITELVTRLFEQPAPVRQVKQQPAPAEPILDSGMGYGQPVPPPQPQNYAPQGGYPPPQQPYYNDPQYAANDYDDYRYEKVNTVDRLKVPIVIAILLLAILLILAVLFMQALSPKDNSDDLNSNKPNVSDNVIASDDQNAPNGEDEPDTEMPNLVDKFYSLCEDKYKSYFEFEVEYIYDNDSNPDVILQQDIEPGKMVSQGSKVKLVVSMGKEGAMIPDYKGLTVSQYESKLKEVGITNYAMIKSNTGYGVRDTISQLQIGGKIVKPGIYFSNKEDEKLNVYYVAKDADVSAQPQYTLPAETTAPAYNVTTAAAVTTAAVVTQPIVTDPPATTPPPVVTDPPAPVVTDPPPPPPTDPQPDDPDVGTW